jgi:hypothetical protein
MLKLYAKHNIIKKDFYVQSQIDSVEPEETTRLQLQQYATCHFYIDPHIYQIYYTFFQWSFFLILLETFYNIIFTRSYHHIHIPGNSPLYWKDFMSDTEITISYIYIIISFTNYVCFSGYLYYVTYYIPTRNIFKYMSYLYSNEPIAHLIWKILYCGVSPMIRKKSYRYIQVNTDTLGVGNHMHVDKEDTSVVDDDDIDNIDNNHINLSSSDKLPMTLDEALVNNMHLKINGAMIDQYENNTIEKNSEHSHENINIEYPTIPDAPEYPMDGRF